MKVYRAIEFSKLAFMLNEDGRDEWSKAGGKFKAGSSEQQVNWWYDEGMKSDRRKIVATICRDCKSQFFEKSLEFNAMRGGRFNPARSFGILYTASSPSVAALEVLYHQFDSAFPLFKNMSKDGDTLRSNFNRPIPEKQELMIIAFEIDFSSTPAHDVFCNDSEARKISEKVGFKRYVDSNFSRDFLFGNDYEIAQIIGCHVHTRNNSAFRVPSARIDFDLQERLDLKNVIIPEKEIDEKNVDLTGKWLEFKFEVDMNLNSANFHEVNCIVNGSKSNSFEFLLEPPPPKRGPHRQITEYLPNTSGPLAERKMFARYVHTQKFK